jgi:hypothetical protein
MIYSGNIIDNEVNMQQEPLSDTGEEIIQLLRNPKVHSCVRVS